MTHTRSRRPPLSKLRVAAGLLGIATCLVVAWIAIERPFTERGEHVRTQNRTPRSFSTLDRAATGDSALWQATVLADRTVYHRAEVSGLVPGETSDLGERAPGPRTLHIEFALFDDAGRTLDDRLLRSAGERPSVMLAGRPGRGERPFLAEYRFETMRGERAFVGWPTAEVTVYFDPPALAQGWRFATKPPYRQIVAFSSDVFEAHAKFELVATRGLGTAPAVVLELPADVTRADVRHPSGTAIGPTFGGTTTVHLDLLDEIGGAYMRLDEGSTTVAASIELRAPDARRFYYADRTPELAAGDLPRRLAPHPTTRVRLALAADHVDAPGRVIRLELRAPDLGLWARIGARCTFEDAKRVGLAAWTEELELPVGWSVRCSDDRDLVWTVPATGGAALPDTH